MRDVDARSVTTPSPLMGEGWGEGEGEGVSPNLPLSPTPLPRGERGSFGSILKIATYNIHKGRSQFNRRAVLPELRERLQGLDADIVFLQEVQGAGARRTMLRRRATLPQPQHEFLAGENWPHRVYGKNAIYEAGHHGNAILSRYPILRWDNQDISAHGLEQRGVLHSEMELPNGLTLHCLCVHLGLLKQWRGRQFSVLLDRIRDQVPEDAPLIVAGDFNDWNDHASYLLARELHLREVFDAHHGRLARSYPAGLPLLRMDRIYVRGLDVRHSEIHAWRKISDHAALSTTLVLP
ncbi:MAG: endonuclease/exonuclease/phosphatase family protein [Gallionellaceae bacterium]|jgi:endonuclease/exonuclease/phosphatase family metal-dependent hydrolase|nr:endonuclease/exonuclease/phosphatase family protein [Gallionellaceae bacterium]